MVIHLPYSIRMKTLLPFLALLPLQAEPLFEITKHPNPVAIDPQIGGLTILPDGRVAAAFHRGEILFYDPSSSSWTEFARGLHEPLGLILDGDDFLVMQRPELTRISDTDGDGLADSYLTVSADFGMTGNYHEFSFGPAKGPDGSYYVGLNVASNGAGIREEIRGQWSEIGDLNQEQMTNPSKEQWTKIKGSAGRMYSRVPYRGWILKISPDGTTTPFASGFRSPDGLGFDAGGKLLVTDNQGDWRGTSPLYTVEEGKHYGHPAALVWRQDWDGRDPLKVPVEELDALRTPASGLMPQGELANSPSQPLLIPDSWGPYAGQILIGDMNQKQLVRYLADEVNGFHQGATLPFIANHPKLGNGNHRFAFDQDGTLWVGKTHLSWAGAEGLLSIKAPPADIFTVTSCKLGKEGDHQTFTLTFSQALADDPESPAIKRWRYHYHAKYGSDKVDTTNVPVRGHHLSPDGKTLTLTLDVAKGYLHELDLTGLRSKTDQEIEGSRLYYQAVEVPE
ncbi:large multi-functional protein [Roseibacillus persicicus]|uniref:Large multi-functional protein n=2 Tax=Roseibacillus persicicus TaxID=454148 RepID=A0A918TSJ2_9BACT|nr:large multi-functional protein [Roseibacillus persicicus]